ncbi:hypothetical protein G6F59_015591 [Rhizopus arrhizus]|nr:hypothetical protein G6F59_015591 [Rhizopus arrhizus]
MLKELRQLRRDRITLAMIVGIPVMQLLLFGYAINLNLRHLDAGVADQANSAASRALVQDMVATGVITPRSEAYSPDQLMQALRRGEISVGIVVPADFARRRFDGREAVQVLVDGSVLHLDTGTAVDIAFDAHARLLRLRHGQMLVETAADPQRPARPFRVTTPYGTLQALGTRFSVRLARSTPGSSCAGT